jgi:ubiquinone/menaquinone biosynthesis C-methylase UbiE
MSRLPVDAALFDKIAGYYKYRTDYDAQFFRRLAKGLRLDPARSRLLDIACGGGQLAGSLGPSAQTIIAVDHSAGMIATAPQRPNIQYVVHDLERAPFVCEPRAHHAVIGRALPLLPPRNLAITFRRSLHPRGAVVVCGSGFATGTPWIDEFLMLLRSLYTSWTHQDWYGTSIMPRLGYEKRTDFSTVTTIAVDDDFLVGNAISYANGSEKILSDLAGFKSRIEAITAPYKIDGKVTAQVLSWGYVYTRRDSVQPAKSQT